MKEKLEQLEEYPTIHFEWNCVEGHKSIDIDTETIINAFPEIFDDFDYAKNDLECVCQKQEIEDWVIAEFGDEAELEKGVEVW